MLAVEKAWRKGNSRREKTMQDRRCIRSRDQRNGILAPVLFTESRRLCLSHCALCTSRQL